MISLTIILRGFGRDGPDVGPTDGASVGHVGHGARVVVIFELPVQVLPAMSAPDPADPETWGKNPGFMVVFWWFYDE